MVWDIYSGPVNIHRLLVQDVYNSHIVTVFENLAKTIEVYSFIGYHPVEVDAKHINLFRLKNVKNVLQESSQRPADNTANSAHEIHYSLSKNDAKFSERKIIIRHL